MPEGQNLDSSALLKMMLLYSKYCRHFLLFTCKSTSHNIMTLANSEVHYLASQNIACSKSFGLIDHEHHHPLCCAVWLTRHYTGETATMIGMVTFRQHVTVVLLMYAAGADCSCRRLLHYSIQLPPLIVGWCEILQCHFLWSISS